MSSERGGVYCGVRGCNNKPLKDKKLGIKRKYCKVPAVLTHQGPDSEDLSRERRQTWLAVLDEDFSTINADYFNVCSDHFVKKAKGLLYLRTDVDWIPTVNMPVPFSKILELSVNHGCSYYLNSENGTEESVIEVRQTHEIVDYEALPDFASSAVSQISPLEFQQNLAQEDCSDGNDTLGVETPKNEFGTKVQDLYSKEVPFSSIHCQSLCKALSAMRHTSQLCDLFLISADRVTIVAHRLVLATSSRLFTTINRGSENGVVTIEVPQSTGEIIEQVVHYAYTGALKLTVHNVDAVLRLCEKWIMVCAIRLCQHFKAALLKQGMENLVKYETVSVMNDDPQPQRLFVSQKDHKSSGSVVLDKPIDCVEHSYALPETPKTNCVTEKGNQVSIVRSTPAKEEWSEIKFMDGDSTGDEGEAESDLTYSVSDEPVVATSSTSSNINYRSSEEDKQTKVTTNGTQNCKRRPVAVYCCLQCGLEFNYADHGDWKKHMDQFHPMKSNSRPSILNPVNHSAPVKTSRVKDAKSGILDKDKLVSIKQIILTYRCDQCWAIFSTRPELTSHLAENSCLLPEKLLEMDGMDVPLAANDSLQCSPVKLQLQPSSSISSENTTSETQNMKQSTSVGFFCVKCNTNLKDRAELVRHVRQNCKTKKTAVTQMTGMTIDKRNKEWAVPADVVDAGDVVESNSSVNDMFVNVSRTERSGNRAAKRASTQKQQAPKIKRLRRAACVITALPSPHQTSTAKTHGPNIVYVCSSCNHSMNTEDEVHAHLRENSQNVEEIRGFRCILCDLTFTQRDAWHTHMAEIHNLDNIQMDSSGVEKRCECMHCGLAFSGIEEKDKHIMDTHSKDSNSNSAACGDYMLEWQKGVYCCKLCDLELKDRTKLNKHIIEDHSIMTKTKALERFTTMAGFMCLHCKKNFLDEIELKKHMEDHHPYLSETQYKEVKLLQCPQCMERYAEKASLQDHIQVVHAGSGDMQNCLVEGCNYETQTVHNLWRHKKYTHSENESTQCDICGAVVKNLFYLGIHKKRQHTNGAMKFPCHLCDFVGGSSSSLSSHRSKKHNSGTERDCPECIMKFPNQSELYSHLFYKHKMDKLPNGKEGHTCHICGFRSLTEGKMDSHIQKHTATERNFACDKCDKRFFCKTDLQRHRLLHNQTKMHYCQYCDYSSVKKFKVTSHISRLHENKDYKPFVCTKCSYRSNLKGNVTAHVRRVHKIEANYKHLLQTDR